MFATPGRQQMVDKENVGSEVKTPGRPWNPLLTPTRKPLAQLNKELPASQSRRSSGKVLQKIWTSSEVTPAKRTPGRRNKSHRKSKGPSMVSSSSLTQRTALSIAEAAESLLNEVLLNEITTISHNAQTKCGPRPSESLSTSAGRDLSSLERTVERLVESTLEGALQELRVEQVEGSSPPDPMKSVTGTPTSDRLWSIALGLDEDSLDSSALLIPQGDTSVFLEDAPSDSSSESSSVIEIFGAHRLDPTPSMEIGAASCTFASCGSQDTGPAFSIYQDDLARDADTAARAVQIAPVRLASSSSGSSNTSPLVSQGRAPISKMGQGLETTTISSVELEPLMGVVPVQIESTSSGSTPIEVLHASQRTRPVEVADICVSVTPVKTVDSHVITPAISSTDVGVSTTPIHSKSAEMIDRSVVMTPVEFTSTSTETTPPTPISHTDGCVMTTPVNVVDGTSMTMPIHLSDANYGTTPISVADNSTVTTPARSTDVSIGTTPLKPVEVLNKSVMTTPTQLMDSAFGTSPVACVDANYGTTPVRLTDGSTATTPTSLTDVSIGTTPTKPVEVLNKSVMVTPVKMTDSAFGTSPVQSADANFGTTPVKSAEVGLCTDPARVTDSSTGTTPVRDAEIAVGTDPRETADAHCGSSPVRLVDTMCGITPRTSSDVSTAITPLAVNVAGTLTSPIVVPAFKLEAESPSQLDPVSLRSHMESACISNELLRREIETLKTTQAELRSQLDGDKNRLEHREVVDKLEQRVEGRQMAKAQVDDLLLQVGEQMNQLALLQGTLDQKSADLAVAQQDKTTLKDHYQKEIHNLQQDLRTAYKQHQQEVCDLHAFYEQNNYEPHYKRAMATITELKTELQAYTDLKDTLDKAAEIQEQFGCIEEAYSLVNALFTKTMDKKNELELKHMEMVEQMKQTNAASEHLQQQLAAAEERQTHLQTQLDDAISAEKDALRCRGQLLRDLEEASREMDEMKTELHGTKLELFGYKGDYESMKTKNEELQKQNVDHFLTESSLEAALVLQGKQWQDTVVTMQALRSEAAGEIENLKVEKTRLAAEYADLKQQLSRGEDLITSLQSELGVAKETLHQRGREMETLKAELEMNREARVDAQKMARQIQSLHQQFKESTEFLEEERVALVESAREAEDQLKVTTLELSRLKVALSQAEDLGSHWKGATENLSEKLQFCQSELDNTKAHAHWMLLNQAAEMRDAADGLTALLKKIQDIYSYLNASTDDLEEPSEPINTQQMHKTTVAKPRIKTKLKSQTEVLPSGSLVASILSAINSTDRDADGHDDRRPMSPPAEESEPTMAKQLPRTPSPSETRLTIGGSGSSAFTAVQTSANQNICSTEEGSSKASEGQEGKDDGVPLVEQVGQARVLFEQMVQVLLGRNETLESSVQDLEKERSQLNARILKSQKQHDRELCLTREQLRESELQERRLRQEIAKSSTSLAEQQQALQYAQQRLQAMADNLQRFSDQKSTIETLQTETAKLTSSLRVAQREKGFLQEQLDTVLSGSSQSSGEGAAGGRMAPQQTAVNSKLIKENLSLKNELEKLRVRLVERQEHYETLNARATKHVRVLEDNWHKADAEVYRLDELFDHCKQLMEQVPASGDEHSNMAALRELLS